MSGPCLSKAEYTAVTVGGAVSSHVTIRGGRTDDMVRVFMDIHLNVLANTSFSRLLFFQLGSEVRIRVRVRVRASPNPKPTPNPNPNPYPQTYSYRATHERLAWGGQGAATTYLPRNCSADGALRSAGSLYAAHGTELPFRQQMSGGAPWWFAFEENTDGVKIDTSSMVVGDRGLVVRSYSARLGGVQRESTSFEP